MNLDIYNIWWKLTTNTYDKLPNSVSNVQKNKMGVMQ